MILRYTKSQWVYNGEGGTLSFCKREKGIELWYTCMKNVLWQFWQLQRQMVMYMYTCMAITKSNDIQKYVYSHQCQKQNTGKYSACR